MEQSRYVDVRSPFTAACASDTTTSASCCSRISIEARPIWRRCFRSRQTCASSRARIWSRPTWLIRTSATSTNVTSSSPKTALSHDGYTAIATHDPKIIDRVAEYAAIAQAAKTGRFEFQMLYGIASPLARRVLARGYRVRLSIPYGEYWFPYLMRRLAERPANLAFFLRRARSRDDKASGLPSSRRSTRASSPTLPRATAYYGELLQRGCDGINLLGTTGEAMSLSAAQRCALHGSGRRRAACRWNAR